MILIAGDSVHKPVEELQYEKANRGTDVERPCDVPKHSGGMYTKHLSMSYTFHGKTHRCLFDSCFSSSNKIITTQ